MKKLILTLLMVLTCAMPMQALTHAEFHEHSAEYGLYFVKGSHATWRNHGQNYKFYMSEDDSYGVILYCCYSDVYNIWESECLDSLYTEVERLDRVCNYATYTTYPSVVIVRPRPAVIVPFPFHGCHVIYDVYHHFYWAPVRPVPMFHYGYHHPMMPPHMGPMPYKPHPGVHDDMYFHNRNARPRPGGPRMVPSQRAGTSRPATTAPGRSVVTRQSAQPARNYSQPAQRGSGQSSQRSSGNSYSPSTQRSSAPVSPSRSGGYSGGGAPRGGAVSQPASRAGGSTSGRR